MTAVDATEQTNLRFFPEGAAVPDTANLNPTPGAPPVPNAVNVTLNDANGRFAVFNRFGSVAVVIDVLGYYDDHTHDDRYYSESEIDALVKGVSEAVAVPIVPDPFIVGFFDFDFVDEDNQNTLQQTFTTDRPGRVEVDMFVAFNTICSPDDTEDRIVFIQVDGVPVPSSAFLERDLTDIRVRLSGFTEASIPAGEHTINYGVECRGNDVADAIQQVGFSVSSVVLYPDP